MSLVINNRLDLAGKRKMHVLIAGVSSYLHLPDEDGKYLQLPDDNGGLATVPATNTYGLRRLSSTAISAYKVYEWLTAEAAKNNLQVPLATCRVLLSPSDGETAATPELANFERCNRDNFNRDLRAWKNDAASDNDDVTFFYFAGHGIQTGKTNSILLLEDFADPNERLLHNAADALNIYQAMAPPAAQNKRMAKTQLYFIDTCRERPAAFGNLSLGDAALLDFDLPGTDDRNSPIFYAALPGTKAYALTDQQTLFSKALLECLNSAAGRPREDDNGNVYWQVSTQSLNEVLSQFFPDLTDVSDSTQQYTPGGQPKDNFSIVKLDDIPMVEISLEIDPSEALDVTQVQILGWDGQPAQIITADNQQANALPSPLDPHPHRCKIQAGYYALNAIVNPATPGYTSRQGSPREVFPPLLPWRRKVGL